MNLKKLYRNLKFGFLKPKIFAILFGLFFSSLALAATLILTHKDNRIPNGASGCFSSKVEQGKTTFVELDNDRTEDLRDVIWSDDGTMVFSINEDMGRTDKDFGDLDLSMNKVRDPFELNTVKTFLGTHTCDDIDGFDVDHPDFQAQGMTTVTTGYTSIHAAKGGKIFYILSDESEVYRYDLSTPFDFSTANYVQELTLTPDGTTGDGSSSIQGFSVSRDGTRLFVMDHGDDLDTPLLKTFSLSPAFDITSATEIHSVNLYDDLGVVDLAGNQAFRDVEFSHDGGAMFISVLDVGDGTRSGIHQFSLGKNFDVSSASHLGLKKILYRLSPGGALRDGTGSGAMWGFSFSSDGMKLFFVQAGSGQVVDNIYQFDLECPYGVVSCTSDSISSLGSQLTLAKQNINLNISTIFKRFEWVKRNRDSENLNSFNLNINSNDPILTSLTNKLQHLAIAKQASLIKKNNKDTKKSKWSYWSHADISIGDNRKTFVEKAQRFRTEGLTFGADKKFGDNKFFGVALRYSDNGNNIKGSPQRTDMESITLNFYGVIPKDEDRYINAVVGLSALRFDQKYLDKLTGERNGKQIFTAINLRSKKTYGNLNFTPSGRLTYGLTYLTEYTDFISNVKKGQNVLYDNDHFETGDFALGFLFNMDQIQYPKGIFTTNGGLEFVYDFTPVVELNFSNPGSSNVNVARLDNYSEQNIKGNIGFEFVYLSGFTISMNYERYQSINTIRNSHIDTILIKFSHLVDDDYEFAFNFHPLKDNLAQLNYSKNINGFDVIINTDYNLNSEADIHGANIVVSNKF